jgi:ATP-binding cassette subfamily B protein
MNLPFLSKLSNSLRLQRAIKLVWQSAPGWTLAQFALMIAQSILPLATLYLMKQIVDSVTFGLALPDKSAAFSQTARGAPFSADGLGSRNIIFCAHGGA